MYAQNLSVQTFRDPSGKTMNESECNWSNNLQIDSDDEYCVTLKDKSISQFKCRSKDNTTLIGFICKQCDANTIAGMHRKTLAQCSYSDRTVPYSCFYGVIIFFIIVICVVIASFVFVLRQKFNYRSSIRNLTSMDDDADDRIEMRGLDIGQPMSNSAFLKSIDQNRANRRTDTGKEKADEKMTPEKTREVAQAPEDRNYATRTKYDPIYETISSDDDDDTINLNSKGSKIAASNKLTTVQESITGVQCEEDPNYCDLSDFEDTSKIDSKGANPSISKESANNVVSSAGMSSRHYSSIQ